MRANWANWAIRFKRTLFLRRARLQRAILRRARLRTMTLVCAFFSCLNKFFSGLLARKMLFFQISCNLIRLGVNLSNCVSQVNLCSVLCLVVNVFTIMYDFFPCEKFADLTIWLHKLNAKNDQKYESCKTIHLALPLDCLVDLMLRIYPLPQLVSSQSLVYKLLSLDHRLVTFAFLACCFGSSFCFDGLCLFCLATSVICCGWYHAFGRCISGGGCTFFRLDFFSIYWICWLLCLLFIIFG